jgi:hypothetical protein
MLTFNPDDFINERFESQPRWVVTLSDGRKVNIIILQMVYVYVSVLFSFWYFYFLYHHT